MVTFGGLRRRKQGTERMGYSLHLDRSGGGGGQGEALGSEENRAQDRWRWWKDAENLGTLLSPQGTRAEATLLLFISSPCYNKLNKQKPCGQIFKTEIMKIFLLCPMFKNIGYTPRVRVPARCWDLRSTWDKGLMLAPHRSGCLHCEGVSFFLVIHPLRAPLLF